MPLAAFFATKGFTVRADARRAFLLYRLTRLGVSPEGAKRCQLNFRSNATGVPPPNLSQRNSLIGTE